MGRPGRARRRLCAARVVHDVLGAGGGNDGADLEALLSALPDFYDAIDFCLDHRALRQVQFGSFRPGSFRRGPAAALSSMLALW